MEKRNWEMLIKVKMNDDFGRRQFDTQDEVETHKIKLSEDILFS